jgi:hypothetical protein
MYTDPTGHDAGVPKEITDPYAKEIKEKVLEYHEKHKVPDPAPTFDPLKILSLRLEMYADHMASMCAPIDYFDGPNYGKPDKNSSEYKLAYSIFSGGPMLGILRGSNIKTVFNALAQGRAMHKAYKAGLVNDALGLYKEFRLPSGKKIDFLDVNKGIVYELKPNNPRALKLGETQAKGYISELQTMERFKGIQWKYVVEPY